MSEEIYLRKYDTITNNVIAYTPNNTLYLFLRRKHTTVMHCKVTLLQYIKRSNNVKQKQIPNVKKINTVTAFKKHDRLFQGVSKTALTL